MHYYAYIDSNNICKGTYSFPSQISDPNYIYLGTPDDERVGVIAQELEKLDERFVKRGEDGYLYVRVNELIFPLIIAVQELLKK